MTKKQMADQVKNWLGLQDISAYDETVLVNDLIYRGTIDLLSRTRCVVRCVHLNTTANQGVYTLDHSIITLVDVDDGATRRNRRDQTTGPGFTLIGADVLRINPAPGANGELDVWAVMLPAQMVSDTDSPGMEAFGAIPEEYQDAIVTYALWKASDYSDDQSGAYGERYRVLYEGQDGRGGRLAQVRTAVNKRGTARGAPRRVTLDRLTSKQAWVG